MKKMRRAALAAWTVLSLSLSSAQADPSPQSESFDVLGVMLDNSQKQISTKAVLKRNKQEAEAFREKIIAGWWEHMQARSGAKRGEYCAAMFQRAEREPRPGGVDLFKQGTAVTVFGPGGGYRGALLAFSPLDDRNTFPKLQNGQKVLVTLKQGNEAPQTLHAMYMTIGASARPMIAFTVPSIELLLDNMEDQAHFEVLYEGQSVARLTWHSGWQARDALKACLRGAS